MTTSSSFPWWWCDISALSSLFVSLHIQSTLDILNTRRLELCPNSNKTLGPFSINSNGVTTRYLERFFRSPESSRYRTPPLIRTRKGPDILFELANIRINRSSGKFKNHTMKIWKKILFILLRILLHIYNLKKSVIEACFFFCVKYHSVK